MKCLRGIPDEESDQAELNERIRTWIRDSSGEDNRPSRTAKFPAQYQEQDETMSTRQHSRQTKAGTTQQSSHLTKREYVPRLVDGDDTKPEPFKIVESVVAMVIAPLSFPQVTDTCDRNPIEEIQSKIANFVPETMDNLRIHTQHFLASFENRAL